MISIKKKVYEIVGNTISRYNLITKNDKIIIGISGGADSVSLLLVLIELKKQYNLDIMMAHVNHMLRGKESMADEKYILGLARKFEAPVEIKRVDVPALKKKNNKMSIEEIGHHERYRFFQTLLKKKKFNKIALGHNLDDSIENYFLRSFDGGALKSICGIKPHENNIIRPLIHCYKKDLKQFVKSCKVSFKFDSTNRDNSYPRNWVRNKLLNYIEKNYKPVKNNISHVINILYHENEYIQSRVKRFFSRKVEINNNFYSAVIRTDRELIHQTGFLRRVIQEIFHKLEIDYNYYIIEQACGFIQQGSKSCIQLSGNADIWKWKNSIIISSNKYMSKYHFEIRRFPKEVLIANLGISVNITLMNRKKFVPAPNSLYFEKSKINEIIIRQKKIGDYINLMNTGFRSRLKKLFADLKIPNALKKMVPVIESNNEVIGIFFNLKPVYITNRIHDKYKVTEKTKKIIRLEFK